MKKLIISLVAVAFLATPAMAGPWHHGWGWGHHNPQHWVAPHPHYGWRHDRGWHGGGWVPFVGAIVGGIIGNALNPQPEPPYPYPY